MAGPRRSTRAQNAPTNIYDDMLAEAGAQTQQPDTNERPLKRRRKEAPEPAPEPVKETVPETIKEDEKDDDDAFEKWLEDEDEDIEFEDVLPDMNVQTMQRDSDDEDEDDEDAEEEHDGNRYTNFDQTNDAAPKELELDLGAARAALTPSKKAIERRKPLTKEEKERRAMVHQVHLLCLLSHVHRRNHWCNDGKVQDSLSGHLSDKIIGLLNPSARLSQFGRAESLKKGLGELDKLWNAKFEITERGTTRALWAEDPDHLQDFEPPEDMDSCQDRDDFRNAARTLQGSRDVGAQLYCALLRQAGVRARLVCSLQPLACVSGAPTMPKPKAGKLPTKTSRTEQTLASIENYRKMSKSATDQIVAEAGSSTARRRLGHPGAASYDFTPTAVAKESKPVFKTPKRIRESAYPVYWVEVLDAGHQKWQPVDAVVTNTFWKPKALEPPITDKENSMSYAIALDADGTAKDVTRRYAKAYTAKTRKLRIENAIEGGDRWWRKTMKNFKSRLTDDLDEIEDNELAGAEAREPMPRNVQDFKDHPIYALERHLRRNEVLVPEATPSGTIGAGSKAPLEKIYRRKDVRVGRTPDKWYRLGREVKNMEIPVKWLPKKAKPRGRLWDNDEEEDDEGPAGTPLYTSDQTELYEPAPVRDGKVPKNKFGNIDVYVSSMVPRGGVHIHHEHARLAAHIMGVDYAPALTGFSFNGRQGTAVLSGVVVAVEYEEAVKAVIEGLADVEQEVEENRRRMRALKMWRRMLMSLRIRERVWAGVDPETRKEAERDADMEAEMSDAESDVTEEYEMEVDDEDGDFEGGGFMADDDGGGFIP